METIDDGRLLRIYVGEDETVAGQPLHEAILELMRRRGLAGATVIRGMAGFGRSSVVHTARFLRMSEDLPVLVEAVDTAEKIEAIVPELDELIADGLMTIEKVEVHLYRGSG